MSSIYISFGDPNDGNIVPLESIHQEKSEMAKIELNTMVNAIRGQVDKAVFKKFRGKTILARQSQRDGEPTPAQAAHQERFLQAAEYGRSVLENTALRNRYAEMARERETSIMAVCIKDFFNPPQVLSIDAGAYNGQPGDVITIRTRDDFGLAKVVVTLIDAESSSPLETGTAFETSPGSNKWIYTARTPFTGITVNVQVTATDFPGGITVRNEIKPLAAA
jgi:hypothetical protein